MGIVSVVMIQTMTGIVFNSARNRDASIAEVELRRFAEKARTAPYIPCGTPVSYNGSDALRDDIANLPAGVTVQVIDVRYWIPPNPAPAPGTPTSVSNFVALNNPAIDRCDELIDDPDNPGHLIDNPAIDDFQLQRLTLEVHAGAYTRQITVVKRWFE